VAQEKQRTTLTVSGSGVIGVVDLTGSRKQTKGKRRFVMAFVDTHDPTLDRRIKDFDRTLLDYMARRMNEANEVRLKQREMATELKTRVARVSEAVGRLRAAGYIETDGYGLIRINPEFYWRTSLSDLSCIGLVTTRGDRDSY
jgi:CRP-like cAMP-binding protein